MEFFHRTTEENWNKIQKEGILYGIGRSYRYTYLSPFDWGESYGCVLLKVEYEPIGPPADNYGFDPPDGEVCTQFSVFGAIPISHVTRL